MNATYRRQWRGLASWRRLFAALFITLSAIVSSSFAYGLYLLVQLPRGSPLRVSRSESQPPDVEALLHRATAHMENREVEQALVAYRHILFAAPSLDAQLGLAKAERMAGREDVAASEYESVLHLDPSNADGHLQLARIRSGQRETWPQAEAHYRQYLSVRPDEAEAQLGLARVLAWQGRAEEAVGLYARPVVQPLLTPNDQRDYALALLTAGHRPEAEARLERLLSTTPGDHDVALALAGLRASRGDSEGALPLYRSVLAGRPGDARANLAYGQGLLVRRDYAAALGPLGKAAGALPSSAEAALAYARAARGAGRLELADEQFQRANALDEDEAEVAREYADLLMERRNYRRAERLYRRAYASGLRDDRLLLGLGGALAANDKPKEAVPLLEEAYARQRSERLAFELARLYKKLGRNDRALELLRQIER